MHVLWRPEKALTAGRSGRRALAASRRQDARIAATVPPRAVEYRPVHGACIGRRYGVQGQTTLAELGITCARLSPKVT